MGFQYLVDMKLKKPTQLTRWVGSEVLQADNSLALSPLLQFGRNSINLVSAYEFRMRRCREVPPFLILAYSALQIEKDSRIGK